MSSKKASKPAKAAPKPKGPKVTASYSFKVDQLEGVPVENATPQPTWRATTGDLTAEAPSFEASVTALIEKLRNEGRLV